MALTQEGLLREKKDAMNQPNCFKKINYFVVFNKYYIYEIKISISPMCGVKIYELALTVLFKSSYVL